MNAAITGGRTIAGPGARSRPRALSGSLDQATAERVAETFRVLGDATRVRIVSTLAGGETRVGDLAESLGLTPSAVSHQLGLLRALHVVRPRRAGREAFYRLDDEHVESLFRMGLDHVNHRPLRARP